MWVGVQLCPSVRRGSQTRLGETLWWGSSHCAHFTDVETGTRWARLTCPLCLSFPSTTPTPWRASGSQTPVRHRFHHLEGLRKQERVWGQKWMTGVTSRPVWVALPTSSTRKPTCRWAGLESRVNEAGGSMSPDWLRALPEPVYRERTEQRHFDQPLGQQGSSGSVAARPSPQAQGQPNSFPKPGPPGCQDQDPQQG